MIVLIAIMHTFRFPILQLEWERDTIVLVQLRLVHQGASVIFLMGCAQHSDDVRAPEAGRAEHVRAKCHRGTNGGIRLAKKLFIMLWTLGQAHLGDAGMWFTI